MGAGAIAAGAVGVAQAGYNAYQARKQGKRQKRALRNAYATADARMVEDQGYTRQGENESLNARGLVNGGQASAPAISSAPIPAAAGVGSRLAQAFAQAPRRRSIPRRPSRRAASSGLRTRWAASRAGTCRSSSCSSGRTSGTSATLGSPASASSRRRRRRARSPAASAPGSRSTTPSRGCRRAADGEAERLRPPGQLRHRPGRPAPQLRSHGGELRLQRRPRLPHGDEVALCPTSIAPGIFGSGVQAPTPRQPLVDVGSIVERDLGRHRGAHAASRHARATRPSGGAGRADGGAPDVRAAAAVRGRRARGRAPRAATGDRSARTGASRSRRR
jgi:hypothetical protein